MIHEEAPVKENWPRSRQGNFLTMYGMIIFPLLAVTAALAGGLWWWVRMTKKEKLRVMDALPIPRALYWCVPILHAFSVRSHRSPVC